MKQKLLLMGGLLVFLNLPILAQDINGTWTSHSEDGQSIFTLKLTHVSKDRVSGVHCIENVRERINECHRPGDDYTVALVQISENIFQGNLLSVRGRNLFERNIQLQYRPADNAIFFSLTRPPQGPLRIPKEAILRRN